MENLIQADIFFAVTTIFVVIIGLGVCLALYYILKILREVKEVSHHVYLDSLAALEEMERLGQSGKLLPTLFKSIVSGVAKRFKKRKKKKN